VRPVPVRDGADRMKLSVGPCSRVLLGNVGSEPLALFVGDLQVAVQIDDVLEAELVCEPRRTGMLIKGLAHGLSRS